MIPTNWSFTPKAVKDAWRKWRSSTHLDITSEAFMAGALWALSSNGQAVLLDELAKASQRTTA